MSTSRASNSPYCHELTDKDTNFFEEGFKHSPYCHELKTDKDANFFEESFKHSPCLCISPLLHFLYMGLLFRSFVCCCCCVFTGCYGSYRVRTCCEYADGYCAGQNQHRDYLLFSYLQLFGVKNNHHSHG